MNELKLLDKLPDHLVRAEISSKLPLRSLVQFKCTCKRFKALITEDFICAQGTALKYFDDKRILQCNIYGQSIGCDSMCPRLLHFPEQFKNHRSAIVGSCNGLVCLVVESLEAFVFWNPTTGKFSHTTHKQLFLYASAAVGFGYDADEDDFKLVMLINDEYYQVYSLGSNSCHINAYPGGRLLFDVQMSFGHREAVFVEDCLHWPVVATNDSGFGNEMSREAIMSYHLRTGRFDYIRLPAATSRHFDLGNHHGATGIAVIDGCLTVFRHSRETIEAWSMKQYGQDSSWTVLYRFTQNIPSPGFHRAVPIGSTQSGLIIWDNPVQSTILLIDPQTAENLIEFKLGIRGLDRYSYKSWVYIESVASPIIAA